MKITSLGANKTLLRMGNNEVLFSYSTPVAGFIDGKGYFRTAKKWSKTTSKHINSYLPTGAKVSEMSQEEIELFVSLQS